MRRVTSLATLTPPEKEDRRVFVSAPAAADSLCLLEMPKPSLQVTSSGDLGWEEDGQLKRRSQRSKVKREWWAWVLCRRDRHLESV